MGSKFLSLPEELSAMSRVQVGKRLFPNFRDVLDMIRLYLQLLSWKQEEIASDNIKIVRRMGGKGQIFRPQKLLQ